MSTTVTTVEKTKKPYKKRNYKKSGVIKGKGAYSYSNPGPWGKGGASLGAMAGRYLGSRYGIPKIGTYLGSKFGQGIGHLVGKLFGSGDYRIGSAVQSNTLFKGATDYLTESSMQQLTFNGSNTSIRIRHREYIKDIITSTTASTIAYDSITVNPGLNVSFPWLSSIAANYQNYKVHGLVYEFVSTAGNSINNTNLALGTVMACADMNSTLDPLITKQDMLNTSNSIMCKPSDNFLLGVECDPRLIANNKLWVRTGSIPTSEDVKFYDMCLVNVATTGFQGTNVNVGSLYVIYDIELFNPVKEINGSADPTAVMLFKTSLITSAVQLPDVNTNYPQYNVNSATTGNLYAVDAFENSAGIITYTTTGGGSSYMYFPPSMAGGVYRVTYVINGDITANVVPATLVYGNGCSLIQSSIFPDLATAATSETQVYMLTIKLGNLGDLSWPTSGPLSYQSWPYIKWTANVAVVPANIRAAGITVTRLNPAILGKTSIIALNGNYTEF